MALKLENGVSVLICTYNKSEIISKALDYLTNQKFTRQISWEVIIVDNGSKDGTSDKLGELVVHLRSVVTVHLAFEPKKGKENAVDMGLKISNYKYVIICDDDNWLSDDYVERAYDIMQSNPTIGLLGGKGIAAFEGQSPIWFDKYQSFFAVGEQHYFNGEIKHFWPRYKFIWGAGSVINKSAYNILLNSGFQRILNSKDVGKIARSEDLELCFAIWLTGFKLWYDDSLTYRHYLTKDRLTDKYLITIIKISTSAIYFLKPYNILKFTGTKFCPKEGFWFQNILSYLQDVLKNTNKKYEISTLINILRGNIIVNSSYTNKLMVIVQFFTSIKLGPRYESNFQKVYQLKKNIEEQITNQTKSYE